MNGRYCSCILAATWLVMLAGCEARPVTGGTEGRLSAQGAALADIQVTLHQSLNGTWQAVGFAITGTDGSFELVQNQAAGALELEPGTYRCTLESVGAPVQIPPEYARAETTPLEVQWSATDQSLQLDLPHGLLMQ